MLARSRVHCPVFPAGIPSLLRLPHSPTQVWKVFPFRSAQNRGTNTVSASPPTILNIPRPVTGGRQAVNPFPNQNAGFCPSPGTTVTRDVCSWVGTQSYPVPLPIY